MDSTIIELEKDLVELEKLLQISTRQNIKRNLENHKKTITSLLDNEKKLQDSKKEVSSDNSKTVKTTEDDKYKYTTITKYAFESSEKFVK